MIVNPITFVSCFERTCSLDVVRLVVLRQSGPKVIDSEQATLRRRSWPPPSLAPFSAIDFLLRAASPPSDAQSVPRSKNRNTSKSPHRTKCANPRIRTVRKHQAGDDVVNLPVVNIDEPRYDQNTYVGRAKHFFITTNPLNVFVTGASLDRAKVIVHGYRNKEPLPESITLDELWRAKQLYDSAFHPDTGEKMNVIGRMSAQVPMNMAITGGMMVFYKTTPAVIFWQWLNQSFNALVNYTNRSGDASISDGQLLTSYVLATGGALVTALGLNRLVKNAPPLVGRLVPFVAVAAANCVNIPLMRSQELQEGTPIYDKNNNKLGLSKRAAQEGIAQVILSRIGMAAPGMAFTPFIMNHLERRGTLAKYPWTTLPIQLALVGFCLTFATPLCCALFKQLAELPFGRLEPELRESLRKQYGDEAPSFVYYNKGL